MSPAGRFIIYALTDPRTGAIRYVGMSTSGMERPRNHGQPWFLKHAPGHRSNWIMELNRNGLTYGISILEDVGSTEELEDAERHWIAWGRSHGWPLTNVADGGRTPLGSRRTPEQRARMSADQRGHAVSEETKAKISKAATGRRVSEEARAKMSEARTGKRMPAGTGERISAALRGHLVSAESRAKMSASQRARFSLGNALPGGRARRA